MLQIMDLESFNWKKAVLGMRNAMESWDKSDSKFELPYTITYTEGKKEVIGVQIGTEHPTLGQNDYGLIKKLCCAGTEHRKFLRQIFVSCHVVAPWYWWKEQETYQIGTTENSTSQMHKMGSRMLNQSDFTIDEWNQEEIDLLKMINQKIFLYQQDKMNKKNWRSLIQIIPASFLYTRTISLNYEVLANQYRQRKEHKLVEWHEYLNQMIAGLPYPELFTMQFP